MVIVMFRLYRHTAAGDVVAVLLKLGRFFANSGFYCIGVRNPPKRDF